MEPLQLQIRPVLQTNRILVSRNLYQSIFVGLIQPPPMLWVLRVPECVAFEDGSEGSGVNPLMRDLCREVLFSNGYVRFTPNLRKRQSSNVMGDRPLNSRDGSFSSVVL